MSPNLGSHLRPRAIHPQWLGFGVRERTPPRNFLRFSGKKFLPEISSFFKSQMFFGASHLLKRPPGPKTSGKKCRQSRVRTQKRNKSAELDINPLHTNLRNQPSAATETDRIFKPSVLNPSARRSKLVRDVRGVPPKREIILAIFSEAGRI